MDRTCRVHWQTSPSPHVTAHSCGLGRDHPGDHRCIRIFANGAVCSELTDTGTARSYDPTTRGWATPATPERVWGEDWPGAAVPVSGDPWETVQHVTDAERAAAESILISGPEGPSAPHGRLGGSVMDEGPAPSCDFSWDDPSEGGILHHRCRWDSGHTVPHQCDCGNIASLSAFADATEELAEVARSRFPLAATSSDPHRDLYAIARANLEDGVPPTSVIGTLGALMSDADCVVGMRLLAELGALARELKPKES